MTFLLPSVRSSGSDEVPGSDGQTWHPIDEKTHVQRDESEGGSGWRQS